MSDSINTAAMTDLEFCRHWVDTQDNFIDPFLMNDAKRRGLTQYILNLQGTKAERMAPLYARFARAGKVFGDAQIDAIAQVIDRAEKLRRQLLDTPITEAVRCLELTALLDRQLVYIRDYFC